MQCLDIHLTPKQVAAIDAALPFDYGQPMSQVSGYLLEAFSRHRGDGEGSVDADSPQFGLDPHTFGYQQHPAVANAGIVDYVPYAAPIDMTKVRESDEKSAEEFKKTQAKET